MSKEEGKRLLESLKAPFSANEIEWRVQRTVKYSHGWKALVLPYVTNRAIQNRLDEVFGLHWSNEFFDFGIKGVKCIIKVKIGDEWISKEDGAEKTEIESVKGGFSSAMKRAAVQFGIGRYLYNLEPQWVPLKEKGEKFVKVEENSKTKYLYWDCPNINNLQGKKKPNNNPNYSSINNSKQRLENNNQSRGNNASDKDGAGRNPSKNDDINQVEAVNYVKKLETSIGLENRYRFPLFKRANNENVSCERIEDGTIEELRNYYDALLPISMIVESAKANKIDQDLLIAVCQSEFEFRVESINNLFLKTNKETAKRIVEKIRQYGGVNASA